MDLRKVFDCMISVSELGRGQASRVIQLVEDTGNPYIVVKNNKPQAVILSIDDYTDLMQAKEASDTQRNTASAAAYAYMEYAAPSNVRADTLTEDEISIFLNDENND